MPECRPNRNLNLQTSKDSRWNRSRQSLQIGFPENCRQLAYPASRTPLPRRHCFASCSAPWCYPPSMSTAPSKDQTSRGHRADPGCQLSRSPSRQKAKFAHCCQSRQSRCFEIRVCCQRPLSPMRRKRRRALCSPHCFHPSTPTAPWKGLTPKDHSEHRRCPQDQNRIPERARNCRCGPPSLHSAIDLQGRFLAPAYPACHKPPGDRSQLLREPRCFRPSTPNRRTGPTFEWMQRNRELLRSRCTRCWFGRTAAHSAHCPSKNWNSRKLERESTAPFDSPRSFCHCGVCRVLKRETVNNLRLEILAHHESLRCDDLCFATFLIGHRGLHNSRVR